MKRLDVHCSPITPQRAQPLYAPPEWYVQPPDNTAAASTSPPLAHANDWVRHPGLKVPSSKRMGDRVAIRTRKGIPLLAGSRTAYAMPLARPVSSTPGRLLWLAHQDWAVKIRRERREANHPRLISPFACGWGLLEDPGVARHRRIHTTCPLDNSSCLKVADTQCSGDAIWARIFDVVPSTM